MKITDSEGAIWLAYCEMKELFASTEEQLSDAKREADSLALSMYKHNYAIKPDAVPFELCDTVAGVVTQIDNMYTGVKQERDILQKEHTMMLSFLNELTRWNMHGACGAQEIISIINKRLSEAE